MKRSNEFLVGLSVVAAAVLVVAAALWLSETNLGQVDTVHTARFQTVGGLGAGNPVTLRGVRVGRVEAIRLTGTGWVETDLKIDANVELPPSPAVIAASSSLFGEWAATIVSREQTQDDPVVEALLVAAARPGGEQWPGATLPDVGQLTAQAGRIAGDIAQLADRVENAFDTAAVEDLRGAMSDFASIASQLENFTESQSARLERITGNLATSSEAFSGASVSLRNTLARVDTATGEGQLTEILNSGRDATADLRLASADIREMVASMRSHEASLISVLTAADSLITRIQSGEGTLGQLTTDSLLYHETTAAVIQLRLLLQDIKANPRRYFTFSVF
ncbi:MAG: MlaD family protein [Gemmatimonadales bacterium]